MATWVLLILAGLFCVCVLIALDKIGNYLFRIVKILEERSTAMVNDPPPQEIARPQWEYQFITPHWRSDQGRFVYHVNDDIDEQLTMSMENKTGFLIMDILGRKGWDLIDIILLDLPPGGLHEKSWNFIFKRPIQRYDVTR